MSRSNQQTRGVRNHNPGNIRRSSDPWQGLAAEQTDPAFFQFISAAYGIRALVKTLITYQDKHGLQTVAEIISRWAPSSENNTGSYISAVRTSLRTALGGWRNNQAVNVHD